MARTVELALPDEFEDNIKRDMLEAAQRAFRAVAAKYHYPEYMQRKVAAEYLGMGVTKLDKLTAAGLPVSVVDGLKIYRKESIDKYMLEHEV